MCNLCQRMGCLRGWCESGKDCSAAQEVGVGAVCVVLVVGHSFPIVVTPPNHLCSPQEGAGLFFSRCSGISENLRLKSWIQTDQLFSRSYQSTSAVQRTGKNILLGALAKKYLDTKLCYPFSSELSGSNYSRLKGEENIGRSIWQLVVMQHFEISTKLESWTIVQSVGERTAGEFTGSISLLSLLTRRVNFPAGKL